MTGILSLTAPIYAAYYKSYYQAGTVWTKINQYPRNIPQKLQGQTLVLFSAYNPGGRLKPLGWNKRMMHQLKEYVARYDYIDGEGGLKNMKEPLVMVCMPLEKAKYLARKFRQNAIVVIRYQRRSKLILLAAKNY